MVSQLGDNLSSAVSGNSNVHNTTDINRMSCQLSWVANMKINTMSCHLSWVANNSNSSAC